MPIKMTFSEWYGMVSRPIQMPIKMTFSEWYGSVHTAKRERYQHRFPICSVPILLTLIFVSVCVLVTVMCLLVLHFIESEQMVLWCFHTKRDRER